MNRILFFNSDGIDPRVLEEHGRLICTLSILEWFLQEAIILIILKREFDPSQKSDVVLADQIFSLSFARKIDLIQKHGLLSEDLRKKLDVVRQRRNLFVHGIGLKFNAGFVLQIPGKAEQEPYTFESMSRFRNFVEDVGGNLVSEFERNGFNLKGQRMRTLIA